MDILFIILSLLIGFIFIITALNKALPFLSNVYSGVITGIDEGSKLITVQYYKKGEKQRGTFSAGNFADSVFSFEFHGHAGMEVNILLNRDGKIQSLMIPKDRKEKKKISWGALIIGMLLFGYGLYHAAIIIISLFR